MGSNQLAKKRGLAHYLHKQWINTKSGREEHAKEIERMRALPVKPRVYRWSEPKSHSK